MFPIGSIIDLVINKDCIVIPDGFLLCDGAEISEDNYPELFFQLESDFSKKTTTLPNIEYKTLNEHLIIVKIIKATNNVENIREQLVGDAEFIVK